MIKAEWTNRDNLSIETTGLNSKAVLVINVPEDFDYRRCSIGGDGNIYYEREGEQRTSIIGNIKNLKPIPQKKSHHRYNCHAKWIETTNDYEDGWNDCVDEIVEELDKQER